MPTYLLFFESEIISSYDMWFDFEKNSVAKNKISCSFLDKENMDFNKDLKKSLSLSFPDCNIIEFGKVVLSMEREFTVFFIIFNTTEDLFNNTNGRFYPPHHYEESKKILLEIRNSLSHSINILVVKRFVSNVFLPEKLKDLFKRTIEENTIKKMSMKDRSNKKYYQNYMKFPFLLEFQTNLTLNFEEEFKKIINEYYTILAPLIYETGSLIPREFSFCELKPYLLEKFERKIVADLISKAFLDYTLFLYGRIIDNLTIYRQRIEVFSKKLELLSGKVLIELNEQLDELKNIVFEDYPLLYLRVLDKYILYEEDEENPDLTDQIFRYGVSSISMFRRKLLLLRETITNIKSEIKTSLLFKQDRITSNTKDDKKKRDLTEEKNLKETKFIDAFKSALEDKEYVYLEPMNKSGGWAEIHYVYSRDEKDVKVAKLYKESIGRINESVYKADAKKLMEINHENVVKVIDKGLFEYKEKKYFYLILEYIKGKNFDEIDSRLFLEKPYSERLNYFVQALDGINEFRENLDLHRDLHPGNIMLSDEDKNKVRTIKIIDPGSSRYYYEPEDQDIDLYSIKEGLINLFLRPEEINKINKSINLKELKFPDFREIINKLSKEEEKKTILENAIVNTEKILTIQKIFEIIKRLIDNITFITEPEDFGGYKKYMIGLKDWDKEEIEDPELIAEIIDKEIKNFLTIYEKDLRYLAISHITPHISFFGDRYNIEANPTKGIYLLIKRNFAPRDHNLIKNQILNDIRNYTKNYFGVKLE